MPVANGLCCPDCWWPISGKSVGWNLRRLQDSARRGAHRLLSVLGYANCGEALAQLRGINHIGPHGYGIQLTFREANRWERLKYWYKGHGVVPVYFWADDPDYAGAERYGTIRLHANRASTTVNHELGHALGLGHNTADATSVMHPGAVPGRLPYPSEQDVRTLIDFYRRRGLVAK